MLPADKLCGTLTALPAYPRRILFTAALALTAAGVTLLALGGGQNTATPAEAGPVFGFIITVNTDTDEDTAAGSLCSLREAIVAASINMPYNDCSTGGAAQPDVIEFNIGSGTPVINIGSNLPLIAGPVIINGNSHGATRVELRGPGSGNLSGPVLDTMAAGSQINRLVINGFPGGVGLTIAAANVSLTGNYIGTDATGTTASPNQTSVRVAGAGVHIGGPNGTTPGGACTGDCNLLSGATFAGIQVLSSGVNALIEGNFVGTDANGTAAIGDGVGMVLGSTGGIVGGLTSSRRNVVSGNSEGIDFFGDTVVEGNFIGPDTTGTVGIGNSSYGVQASTEANGAVIGGTDPGAGNLIASNSVGVSFFGAQTTAILGNTFGTGVNGDEFLPNGFGIAALGASNNTIGGTGPGEANTIQFSSSTGVNIDGLTSAGNSIRGNSIFSSGGKGIDNTNGGNNELSPPVVNTASHFGASGTACPACTIDVYSDQEDEGEVYEGATTANGAGQWTFNGSLEGPNITATATDAGNNTSAFSEPRTIPFPSPTPSPTPSPSPTGTPGPERIQGDVNCSGAVNIDDFVLLIQFAAGVNDGTTPGDCPDVGGAMPAGGTPDKWGDVNCDDVVDALDALGVLAWPDFELPHPDCEDIGHVLA